MHYTAPFTLISVAMASRSVILEAPDDACGFLNGMEQAPFGCHNASEKCAIYYPTSSMVVPATMLPMITPAPQPSVVCYEPSQGDCTVQPTACVDTFGDCTGTCSDDPMTLKCTAESHLYCNRAHFESPLSFRNIVAMYPGLRSTDAPADGWFCGPSASPVQQVDVSHSETASMPHLSSSPVSITTTLGTTITLSRPGPGLSPSVSPTTTLSVTITLSRPGQTPGPWALPSPPATIISEDNDCEDDTHGRDCCCLDERDTSGPCCNEAPWALQQRRQAADGPEAVGSPVAASKDSVGRGSAIVSTAYIGQTNRLPLAEATRPWNVVIPTAVTTPTTTTVNPRIRPPPRKGKKGKKNQPQLNWIIPSAILGGAAVIASVCCIWIKLDRRSKSRRQGLSPQHENGHELVAHGEQFRERVGRHLRHIDNLGSIADHADDFLGMARGPVLEGQPGLAFENPPDPALRRHQQISLGSTDATDGDVDDPAPQSEGSLEQEADENALGIRGWERRTQASNVPRGRMVMF